MMLMARSVRPVRHDARGREERPQREAQRFDWRPGERVDGPPRRVRAGGHFLSSRDRRPFPIVAEAALLSEAENRAII